ncbi:hypothetical protein GCM10008014_47160 [Paenibacillus silvae]|uniref:Uncharacterized protein n=1 Tax=Paenibacillus silvae TaxID=1325358 RepID=A0ABQ1ZJE2_9BACL|nr:hypothetical protein GCM10008014_47160 [Paenibacillus silvae]
MAVRIDGTLTLLFTHLLSGDIPQPLCANDPQKRYLGENGVNEAVLTEYLQNKAPANRYIFSIAVQGQISSPEIVRIVDFFKL